MSRPGVFIIGAGPAGLSAAHELVENDCSPTVLEARDNVGGIARTETFENYHFDIGGHRFFTKNRRINQLWHQMMGDDYLSVSRLSRIYYRGLFFRYPLRVFNALKNLGLKESFFIGLSYLWAQFRPSPTEENFEQWVCNRFGRRLYLLFFKSYTEKVWGIPCSEIQAAWAAQRIKGLSLLTAVVHSLVGPQKAKSLIDRFDYPRMGPGMMWQRFADHIEQHGGQVIRDAPVVRLEHQDGRIDTIVYSKAGIEIRESVDQVLSSAPITDLIDMLDPETPQSVQEARRQLKHRAFVIVLLIVEQPALFPDQWIYIHNPNVQVGRIQNFKNWSAEMVPNSRESSIGMEYFCNENDGLWSLPDDALGALAAKELEQIGLARAADVRQSRVVRQSHAYPVYDRDYATHLETIRQYLKGFNNLETMGRNGTHRYNNMDHSVEAGYLAARSVLGDPRDVWRVNEDAQYLEEVKEDDSETAIRPSLIIGAVGRLSPFAFASAFGTVLALVFFLLTFVAGLLDEQGLVEHLTLLNQYFPGYTVSWAGSALALGYGLIWGFLFGWIFAYCRNLFLTLYLYRTRSEMEYMTFRDFMDQL